MEIKKELKHCLIEGEAFYSIPFKGVIGNKIVVIASNREEAKEKLSKQAELYKNKLNRKKKTKRGK
jgi:AmiR/NasT family two-component response regulator